MDTEEHRCPNCGDLMVPTVAALKRGLLNVIFFGFGSSVLQVKPKKGRWLTFMNSKRSAQASYCPSCGSLLMAPTLAEQRRELGID